VNRSIIKPAALLLLSLSGLSAQEMANDIPDRKTLEAISGNPGIIKTEVSQEREEGTIPWIGMYTDVHILSAIPMDRLKRTILDFEGYPRIFRRNQRTVAVRKNDAVYLDMSVGAEFLGIEFLVKYRVLVTETLNTPEEFILDFSHVSGDGGVKDVSGRWRIKKLPQAEGAEPQCYIRYYAYSKVARKYPLQRMIMSLFIHSESRDLMTQFIKAAGPPSRSSNIVSGPPHKQSLKNPQNSALHIAVNERS
jgi:hypothetical protein